MSDDFEKELTPEEAPESSEQQPEEVASDVDEFAAAMASGEGFDAALEGPRRGDIIRGTVAGVSDDGGVLVDIGTKTEGLIPRDELDEELQPGQEVDVFVASKADDEGVIKLSKKRADFEKLWDKIIEAKNSGEIIEAMVIERVKGGLRVDLGVNGFVPGSQISSKPGQFDRFVGHELRLRVLEVDRRRQKVILSHKAVADEERAKSRKQTWEKLQPGETVEGKVRSLTPYGAFVDFGGVSGLLHVSDMSWTRIDDPAEVVKVGDTIKVMVLEVDTDRERISLGLKQILPDPWKEVGRKYRERQLVHGVITRCVPSGCFVKLPEGVEAFMPIGELAEKRINKCEEVVQVGQEVDVLVLNLRAGARRMTVSLSRAAEQQERQEVRTFIKSQDTGAVTLGDVFGSMLTPEEDASQPEAPAAEAPAEEPKPSKAKAKAKPAVEEEAPEEEAPEEEAPVEEAVVEETVLEEAPVEETVAEAPVEALEEAPAEEETPTEEKPEA